MNSCRAFLVRVAGIEIRGLKYIARLCLSTHYFKTHRSKTINFNRPHVTRFPQPMFYHNIFTFKKLLYKIKY
jgi:hypothetical protein